MAIDENSTTKDYSLIIYNKTEIDGKLDAETIRVNDELDTKLDKQSAGSPIGIATLGITGKHTVTQIPFSSVTDSGEGDNNHTVITPERTLYQIGINSIPLAQKGAAGGVCPLGGNLLVDPIFLPPTQNVQTYVVPLLTDMYNLIGVLEGDRCVVTTEVGPVNNGEYVALNDINVAPSDASNWDLLPNLSAVQSVNSETGNVFVTKTNTPDIQTNANDIATVAAEVVVNSEVGVSRWTFTDQTAVDLNTITTLGNHAVAGNNMPPSPFNPAEFYATGIITVYGDERVVSDGIVQLFWNGALITDGQVDGAYIARNSIDQGVTWSTWKVEPVYTKAEYFDFDPQQPPLDHEEGRFFYDDASKTHVGYTDIVGVSRNYGEQFDIRGHNITGTVALNGRAVRSSGSSVNSYPTLTYADTTSFVNARVAGVLTNDISNGNDGYATVIGSVGVDTTDVTLFDWTPAVGDSVYLNDSGTYSNTRSAIFSYIAQITVIGVDGNMFVKPTTVVDTPSVGAFMDKLPANIPVSTSPIAVQGYEGSESNGMVIDDTLGVISIPYDGLYEFTVDILGTAAVNKQELYVDIRELTDGVIHTAVTDASVGGNNTASMFFAYKKRLVAGSQYVLDFWGESSYTLSLTDMQFGISSISIDTGF